MPNLTGVLALCRPAFLYNAAVSDRIIPLEPITSGGEDDGPIALTDVVVALHLEGLPAHHHDGEPFYDCGPLSEAVVASFALGCAVGIDFPARIEPVLDQTHPGQAEHVIAECRGQLEQQAAAARQSSGPIEPEDFLDELLQALEGAEHADVESAQNALSMSFEYGLILARVQRSAAMVLRNAFNRSQQEAVVDFGDGDTDEELPPGPDPFESLQELAREIMDAYDADIGFSR